MLPYKENESFTDLLMAKEHRLPNFGMSVFPEELAISPKWIVAKTGNLKFWKGKCKAKMTLRGRA